MGGGELLSKKGLKDQIHGLERDVAVNGASNARRRVAVIVGEKVSVMICGATSVGLRCARTRGSPAEMVLREVLSIKICSKLEMKRDLFSGSTLFITTRAGRT